MGGPAESGDFDGFEVFRVFRLLEMSGVAGTIWGISVGAGDISGVDGAGEMSGIGAVWV